MRLFGAYNRRMRLVPGWRICAWEQAPAPYAPAHAHMRRKCPMGPKSIKLMSVSASGPPPALGWHSARPVPSGFPGMPAHTAAQQREKHVLACRHRRCFFGGAKGNRAGPGREAAATVLDEAELVVVDGDAVAAGGDGVVELVEKDAGQGRLRP